MAPSAVIDLLGAATRRSRNRYARDTLIRGRPRRRDRVLGSFYWSLSVSMWAEFGQDPGHLEAYGAGLERAGDPAALLDLGTGTGASAVIAARRFPEARVVGVDKSRTMLARARRANDLPNLEFRRASLWKLPFDDGAFELVTMLNCFPELGELARVTAPGARVLMTTSYGSVEERTRIYRERWPQGGFELREEANVGRGTFELYARA
ncbi:MAG TPA: class I SAM-dependent methyltransferase [Thermoleophilaceae bacterium]